MNAVNFYKMTPLQRDNYMAQAKRVFIKTHSRYDEKSKNFYLVYRPTIRGVIVSHKGKCDFSTKEEALTAGRAVLKNLKAKFK